MKDSLTKKKKKMGRNVITLTAGAQIYLGEERVFAQNLNLTNSWGNVSKSLGVFWHNGFLEAGEVSLRETERKGAPGWISQLSI